ncbi:hypothetical protein [Vibrio parahaemolyticus RIMD 2210633]|uniref:Uncharacterized protein n=1 Tax=Vibrio parahaemolyticus serotype O3:K6 (strain RIMD 2210633) TaxID=223926 RepID=Q87N64_VIBPA|nr:hypothetical protein [Vibrio parahaemolyticus RIMD 2210633]
MSFSVGGLVIANNIARGCGANTCNGDQRGTRCNGAKKATFGGIHNSPAVS